MARTRSVGKKSKKKSPAKKSPAKKVNTSKPKRREPSRGRKTKTSSPDDDEDDPSPDDALPSTPSFQSPLRSNLEERQYSRQYGTPFMARKKSNDQDQERLDSGLSRAQIRRAISYIDVSQNGKINARELTGALTSTDLKFPEVRELMSCLIPEDVMNVDLDTVKDKLIALLSRRNDSLRILGLRALVKLLKQREDEAKSYFEWNRFFKGRKSSVLFVSFFSSCSSSTSTTSFY